MTSLSSTSMDEQAVERAMTGEPDWRVAERRRAFAAFEALPMPGVKDELWKYVELDFDLTDFALVGTPGTPGDGRLGGFTPQRRVVVVDGIAVDVDPGDRSDGVWVGGLAAAVAEHPEPLLALDDHVGAGDGRDGEGAGRSGIAPVIDRFGAAHRAFGGDGALIHVGKGRVSDDVLVEVHAATDAAVSFPRIVIVAEEQAQVSVAVHLRSEPGVAGLVVPQIEIVGGPGSNIGVSLVQNLGRAMRSIGHASAVLDRDASLTFAEAGLGARLSRLQLSIDLQGRGSSGDVVGAYFGDRDQVLDYRYFMRHAGLNTRSNMFLKGAVEDQALSVFTGMIRIEEGAQRTDAFQTNRNLILSEGAAAQSVPNLEILANDVQCGHGSTVGPLDEEQRYYLMSRGLDPERADRLQVRGFFEEALARFPHPQIAAPLREWINAKFVEAQEEGRV